MSRKMLKCFVELTFTFRAFSGIRKSVQRSERNKVDAEQTGKSGKVKTATDDDDLVTKTEGHGTVNQ